MNPVPAAEVEERLESLEGKLEALAETVRRLERRLAVFEACGPRSRPRPPSRFPSRRPFPPRRCRSRGTFSTR